MPPRQKPLPLHERAAFNVGHSCEYGDFSKTQLYRYMNSGLLPFKKLGHRRIILREDLDRLITPTA